MTFFNNTPASVLPPQRTLSFEDPLWAPLKAALARMAPDGFFNIAYSSGFDSRFLAFMATHLGYRVKLWHIRGPHIPVEETEEAQRRAEAMGLTVTIFDADPTRIADFVAAGKERCYVCKRAVFSTLLSQVEGPLADGTNASDRKQYRPGERALKELGVFSPWAEAGFEKPRMRELAAMVGFPDPDQPSRPCLMTRFPYSVQPQATQFALATRVERGLLERYPTLPLRCRFPDGKSPVVHVDEKVLNAMVEKDPAFVAKLTREVAELAGEAVPVVSQSVLSGFFDRQK